MEIRDKNNQKNFFFNGQIAGNLTMKHGDLEIQSSHVCGGYNRSLHDEHFIALFHV